MKHKEYIIGAAAAIIAFLSLLGFDILPLIFLIGLAGAIYFITDSKLLKVKSSSVGEGRKDSSISFNDIGGQEIAKNELREALEFIKSNDKLKALGIRPLKGILLNGPPGTGKTLLANTPIPYFYLPAALSLWKCMWV